MRRVMGEVLRDDSQMPATILREHVAILDAVIAGDRARGQRRSAETTFLEPQRSSFNVCTPSRSLQSKKCVSVAHTANSMILHFFAMYLPI